MRLSPINPIMKRRIRILLLPFLLMHFVFTSYADNVEIESDRITPVLLGTDHSGPGTATIATGVTVETTDTTPPYAVEVIESDPTDSWTIDNNGSLLSNSGDSIHCYTAATVNNYGTIASRGEGGAGVAAVFSDAGISMTLYNDSTGLIQGDGVGVLFDLGDVGNTGSINNQGAIEGATVGVEVAYGGTTLTNSGTITGLDGPGVIMGGLFDTSSYTLINSGTIIGNDTLSIAVSMSDGDDTVELQTGTRIIGGDIDAGPGSDTLNLHGSGEVTWINWNFEELYKDWSGLWELQTDLSLGGVSSSQILDGELRLDNISLTSATFQIDGPGTLSGAGILTGSITNDGTISLGDPGDPLGTLEVSGTADFNAGSKLVVDIGAQDTGDLLDVTGLVTIAGTTDAIWVNEYTAIPQGDFATVITANTLGTSFGSLEYQQGSSFIVTFGQQVVGDDLQIVVTTRNPYSDYASGENQFRVAEALYDSVGLSTEDLGRVLAHLDFLSEPDLQNAFEQLQPKPYVTHPNVVKREGDFIRSNLSGRMRERRQQLADEAALEGMQPDSGSMSVAGAGFMLEPLDYSQDVSEPIPLSEQESGWNSYVQTYTLWAEEKRDAAIDDFDALTLGAFYGIDKPIGRHLVGGLCAGAGATYMETDVSGSNGTKLSLHFGPYLSFSKNGWVLEGSATAGANWLSSWRPIDITGLSRKAKGSYDSYDLAAEFATLYDFKFGGFTLAPEIRLMYDAVFLDGFTESGADSISLVVSERWIHSLNHWMGGRLGYDIKSAKSSLRPEAWVAWMHDYLDGSQTVQAAFAELPQNDFTISSPGTARERLHWGAGITLSVPAFTGYLHYQAEIYQDTWNHGIQGGVRF